MIRSAHAAVNAPPEDGLTVRGMNLANHDRLIRPAPIRDVLTDARHPHCAAMFRGLLAQHPDLVDDVPGGIAIAWGHLWTLSSTEHRLVRIANELVGLEVAGGAPTALVEIVAAALRRLA